MRSLFVYDPHDLDSPIPGGVQICTKEFLAVVIEASSAVHMYPVTVTCNPVWRIRRKLGIGSYLYYHPSEFRQSLAKAFVDFKPTHVFLNRTELLRLAPLLRHLSPHVKIVILSHGNQSGDDLYEVAGPSGRRSTGFSQFSATWRLGSDLITESRYRHRWIDFVCVMSEEEETLERWLGTGRTFLVPRLIQPALVDWQPVSRRTGFVGTLNHTPNRIALERIFDQLVSRGAVDIEFRLVGGPDNLGHAFADHYPFVHYLGRLNDSDLRKEVASWSLFLNPIFWLSRGASMKLGQALSWGIPSLSTRSGVRGYQLSPGQVSITADSVFDFVSDLHTLLGDTTRLVALRDRLLRYEPYSTSLRRLSRELRLSLT